MNVSTELPPIPDADERARLDALERLHILDTMPEQSYEDLVLLAAPSAARRSRWCR